MASNRLLLPLLGLFSIGLVSSNSCGLIDGEGSDENDQRGRGRGEGGGVRDLSQVQLSKRASATALTDDETITECQSQRTDSESSKGPQSGICITPINVTGLGTQVNLNTDSISGACGPGRLLQLGSTTAEGLQRGGIVVDLLTPKLSGGETSLDCEDFRNFSHVSISLEMPYIDVKQKINDSYWTVRYVFEANPLTEEEEFAKSTCAYSAQQDSISGWAFLPTTFKVKRGDVLLCEKTEETAVCADSDFQWLDTATNNFTTTRPAAPHQLALTLQMTVGKQPDGTWGDVFCNTDCDFQGGEPYCGISSFLPSITFVLAQANQFKLHTEIKAYKPKLADGQAEPTGTLDEDYLNGAYNVFTHTNPAGQVSVGTKLKIDVKLDLSSFIFAPDNDDKEAFLAKSKAEIFKSLQIRDQWRKGSLKNFGHKSDQPATVDIEVLDASTFATKESNSEKADEEEK